MIATTAHDSAPNGHTDSPSVYDQVGQESTHQIHTAVQTTQPVQPRVWGGNPFEQILRNANPVVPNQQAAVQTNNSFTRPIVQTITSTANYAPGHSAKASLLVGTNSVVIVPLESIKLKMIEWIRSVS